MTLQYTFDGRMVR